VPTTATDGDERFCGVLLAAGVMWFRSIRSSSKRPPPTANWTAWLPPGYRAIVVLILPLQAPAATAHVLWLAPTSADTSSCVFCVCRLPWRAQQTTQAERQARGQLGVCAPEEEWELRRRECDQDFVGYVPSHSHHRAMRSMHEFEDDEIITSVDGLERVCASLAQSHGKSAQRTSLLWGRRRSSMRASGASSEAAAMQPCERERIVFVCIEDARLGVQLAAQIGPTLKALTNLEVVILKGVGLSSIEKVQGTTRLLYLDLSGNSLFEVDEVERFLRECESLVWADFDGNPCLKDPEAEPKMLAASSWTLRHLNQQPIEIRRKVAAIMKHGDAAARCTLCDQVWDAQVCSTHAVSSKRVVDPVRLERLELPGAGLSVFHVGLFSSLTLLDLSVCTTSTLTGKYHALCLIACSKLLP
jgi:hypothetical protein